MPNLVSIAVSAGPTSRVRIPIDVKGNRLPLDLAGLHRPRLAADNVLQFPPRRVPVQLPADIKAAAIEALASALVADIQREMEGKNTS